MKAWLCRTYHVSARVNPLSYCLNQKNIDQPLTGVDPVNQLIDNLKAVDYKMNHDALIKINALKVDNLDLLNPSLWN